MIITVDWIVMFISIHAFILIGGVVFTYLAKKFCEFCFSTMD